MLRHGVLASLRVEDPTRTCTCGSLAALGAITRVFST